MGDLSNSGKKSSKEEVWDLTKKDNIIAYFTNHLKSDLEAHGKIVTLNLSRMNLGDKGAAILANILKGNVFINKVDLSWNKIGRHGSRHIVDILLVRSCNLKSLSLKVC